jgi:DNA gyrase subunit A
MEQKMDMGLVRKVDIDHEMQQSFLDYSMSVIVSRALPDARDGLKPVQRRLLYAMYDMGIRPDSTYKKSARIVGEVLGKYHPHGDQAVYEAMARMAQDFSMRYPIIDGQGNFGSVDGDPPAAMRYTEGRITPFALDIINQLDRQTVDFAANFDDTLKEPAVLPAAIPNLLVNGAIGIAVGMATNIPPHNLGEVIDALKYLLDHWTKLEDVTVGDLMQFIQGPDFPTGGIILQEHEQNDILSAYATGKGRITLRGRVQTEEMARGKSRIIVTELPFMVNKAALIERIAELSREGGLEGLADLRDETDRHGMRVVIELAKSGDLEKVLSDLFKKTPLQVTYGINLLALVNGEPRLLTLKHALKAYLEHRLEVVKRRSEYDLARAQERLHILEGLRIALKNLDEIIALIRGSADSDQAKIKLVKRYKLSTLQAQAILDLPLKRLASLERKKIDLEYKELLEQVKNLQGLLKSEVKRRQMVIEELSAIKSKYTDRRRTQIVKLQQGKVLSALPVLNDVIADEKVWVSLSAENRIGKFREQNPPRLGGKNAPKLMLGCHSNQVLYAVNQIGKCAALNMQAIPFEENGEGGIPVVKLAAFGENDRIVAMLALPGNRAVLQDATILTVTSAGMVKRSSVGELPGPAADLFTLVKVNDGDELLDVQLVRGEPEVLVISQKGMGIRFGLQEVRVMGLAATGVNAMKLSPGDGVVSLIQLPSKGELLAVASDGLGWRFEGEAFPLQGRYGAGVIGFKLAATSRITGVVFGKKNSQVSLHCKKAAAKVVRIDEIPAGKRATAGKKVIELKPNDEIARMVICKDFVEIREAKPATKRSKPTR